MVVVAEMVSRPILLRVGAVEVVAEVVAEVVGGGGGGAGGGGGVENPSFQQVLPLLLIARPVVAASCNGGDGAEEAARDGVGVGVREPVVVVESRSADSMGPP